MSSIIKKALIGGLAALTFGLAVAETSTPAMAWGRGGWGGGGFHGGWGGRGWGGRGWGGRGWGGVGAGLALGAVAAGAAYGYPYYGYGYPYYGYGGCWQQQPVYDAYGNFRGYRPVAVC